MKLSISNIGWIKEIDSIVYQLILDKGFTGIEIAPTRIFADDPYLKLEEAREWSYNMKQKNGLVISSMQSIWYGRQEKMFESEQSRLVLCEYTKKAIDFAQAIGCKNLVFGCPKNRYFFEEACWKDGVDFFKELGDYAMEKGTVIGMEANPAIYGTNYINNTASALELIEEVDSLGFRLNLDVGTMIANDEEISNIKGKVKYINHVHISEPELKCIQKRKLHNELNEALQNENYQKFVSIEMGKQDNMETIEDIIDYVKNVFDSKVNGK